MTFLPNTPNITCSKTLYTTERILLCELWYDVRRMYSNSSSTSTLLIDYKMVHGGLGIVTIASFLPVGLYIPTWILTHVLPCPRATARGAAASLLRTASHADGGMLLSISSTEMEYDDSSVGRRNVASGFCIGGTTSVGGKRLELWSSMSGWSMVELDVFLGHTSKIGYQCNTKASCTPVLDVWALNNL